MTMARWKCHLGSSSLALATVFLLGFVVLGACGGNEETTITASDGPAGAKGDGVVVDEAAVATMDASEFAETVTRASNRLIERHGGDLAASCAVLLALDRGYDACQMLTGAIDGRLEADGQILAVDGSVVAPTRPAEGFIELAADSVAGNSGSGAARASGDPILLASLSASVVLADTLDPASMPENARILENMRTLGELYDHFDEVRQGIRRQQREEALREQEALQEQEKQQAQEEQRKREEAWDKARTTTTLIWLVTDGYTAEQIIEAIILGECEPTWSDAEAFPEWGLTHPSGRVPRPVYEPVTLSDGPRGPRADKDAPSDYDAKDIEAALAGAGDGSGMSSGDGKDKDGLPSVAREDRDGIPDGLYLGQVHIVNHTAIWTLEIIESVVELEVTDSGIVATVEFVTRQGVRMIDEEEVCVATYRMLFFGSGPVTNPLTLTLQAMEQEIISLEGTHCGVSDRWDTTAEEDLLATFAEGQGLPLTGSFADGLFKGSFSPLHEVSAAISG